MFKNATQEVMIMSDERGVVKGRIDIRSHVADLPSGEWHNEALTSVNDSACAWV